MIDKKRNRRLNVWLSIYVVGSTVISFYLLFFRSFQAWCGWVAFLTLVASVTIIKILLEK